MQIAVLFGYTAWLFGILMGFGVGPATALLARCALPRILWVPVTLLWTAGVAYGIWWVYFANPTLGRPVTLACWLGSAALFGWLVTAARDARANRTALLDVKSWLPAAIMLVLTLAYLCVLSAREVWINDRFTWPLPPDNAMPSMLAERLEVPPLSRPRSFLRADWLTSDRPPLQAGVVLAARPFDISWIDSTYQIVGTLCQMGWAPVLIALTSFMGLSRRQMTFALVGSACSGFFLLHSLYAWPKLLAAWLFLLGVALMYWAPSDARRIVATKRLLIGAALGLSLLAHGGTAFSLIALPLLAVSLRVWRGRRLVAATLGVMLTMFLPLAPWVLYQKLIDPPGNRLVKIHLAGDWSIDDRSVMASIVDAYAELSPREYWSGRAKNLVAQFVGTHAPSQSIADRLRVQQFYHHAAALDLLGLGLGALWLWPLGQSGSRGAGCPGRALELTALSRARQLAGYAVVTVIVWAALTFTPGSAVIHHGSYAATALLFLCGSVGLTRWSSTMALAALGGHCVIFTWLWLATRDLAGPPAPWRPEYVIALAGLIVLLTVLIRLIPDTAILRQHDAGRHLNSA
ncbi:MAG: hypothetical protein ACRD2X_16795 [Vicinamibacteraceae bacterium]